MRKVIHSFEVRSNESACRKKVRLGLEQVIRSKVDADHAADTVTRRSHTCFLVYINLALLHWFSKKQASVESSSFGSEFVSMKHFCEYIRGRRYKLRMMGIAVEVPAYIQGDNKYVLVNTTIPDSTLKKKSKIIAYVFLIEGAARDKWITIYVNTHDNQADLLTNQLSSGGNIYIYLIKLLHHVFRT